MIKKTTVNKKSYGSMTSTAFDVYKDYIHGVEVINQPYTLLGNKSPIDYWNDGRKRFNSVFPGVDTGINNWKSDYFSQMTRNKLLGFIAHIENQTIQPSIRAQNKSQKEDRAVADFLSDSIEYTQEKEEWDNIRFWSEVTGAAEGTVIVTDQFGKFRRNGKEIEGAYSVVVPNDEFLQYDPFLGDIQEQEWVMWRRKMTYGRAKRYYGDYPNFNQVVPGKSDNWGFDIGNELRSYDSFADLKDNEVEILIRFKENKMDIVCAGIQLTEDDTENPREDAQYPFSRTFFEPIDLNFAFGKSLPDKLSKEQDTSDNLWRTYINRQELRNRPPLQTNRPDLINEEIIIPGNAVYVGDVAEAEVKSILPQLESGIDQGTVNLIEAMRGNASDSSLNNQQMGASGGTDTATESLQIAKNAQIMLGLYGRNISFLIRDWTRLRANTILWMLKTNKLDFSKIVSSDKMLSSGKLGTRRYEPYEGIEGLKNDTEKGVFTRLEKSMELKKFMDKSGGKEEKILIDPAITENIDFYIYTDGEPKPKKSDVLAKAMAKEDYIIYSQRPDIFNQRVVAEDYVLSRGGNPDRILNSEQQMQQPMPQQIQQQQMGQTQNAASGISDQLLASPKKILQQ